MLATHTYTHTQPPRRRSAVEPVVWRTKGKVVSVFPRPPCSASLTTRAPTGILWVKGLELAEGFCLPCSKRWQGRQGKVAGLGQLMVFCPQPGQQMTFGSIASLPEHPLMACTCPYLSFPGPLDSIQLLIFIKVKPSISMPICQIWLKLIKMFKILTGRDWLTAPFQRVHFPRVGG